MLLKNSIHRVTVEDVDGFMNGVAHVEGQAVFIKGALEGEEMDIKITKAQKTHAFARIDTLHSQNPHRQSPSCKHYKTCGGCVCMHMDYAHTLEVKRRHVQQVLKRIGGISIDVPEVMGGESPFSYRNKTALPIEIKDNEPVAGFYMTNSHTLVPIDTCLIAKPPSNEAVKAVLQWMKQEKIQKNLVRHVVCRVNQQGEIMVVLVINGKSLPKQAQLLERLQAQIPKLASLAISINRKDTNVILGNNFTTLYGNERLQDTLCGFSYALSPLSFYQINRDQAERLYQTALDFASLTGEETVADMYCGAGTISLLLAQKAKHVHGVEIVKEAIADAKMNAKNNGVTNVTFYAEDAKECLPRLVKNGQRFDTVVLDPPRKGVDTEVLDALLTVSPKKIVYVSCNVATQARDAKYLCERGYKVEKVQAVDMFCWTGHVETVMLLTKRNPAHPIETK